MKRFGLSLGSDDGDDIDFDPPDAYVPEHLPDPGPFVGELEPLTDEEHLGVHETARELFEERGVYDVTFGYNLARLNRDPRHPAAGFRYAVDEGSTEEWPGDEPGGDGELTRNETAGGGPRILRAEFTPTSAFCPQADALARASFRAWNGLRDRHEFDLVKVRVDPLHRDFGAINSRLTDLEREFVETGEVPDPETES